MDFLFRCAFVLFCDNRFKAGGEGLGDCFIGGASQGSFDTGDELGVVVGPLRPIRF